LIKDQYSSCINLDLIRFVNSGYLRTDVIVGIEMPYGVKKLDVLKKFVDKGIFKNCEHARKQIGRERLRNNLMKNGKIQKVVQVANKWQLNFPFDATGTHSNIIS